MRDRKVAKVYSPGRLRARTTGSSLHETWPGNRAQPRSGAANGANFCAPWTRGSTLPARQKSP